MLIWLSFHRSDAELFLVHHSRRHMLSINIITSDIDIVSFDHLVMVILARLLHYEVTVTFYG